ncbi:unnamed protein product [Rotaria sordida]|uniref:Disease resistance R13L4/SHOC-2-like LRR domain-containing protein n=1 Tax=Rotaria sordida TaxID=392033 RepID=A0A814V896_9BILA|nr:unnamed protein product [Rotaria sordida]CAF3608164.1 unnamed protein product [Rotaria sordida]
MASSDRRTSLSPSERQRTKSQSSYRSYRTTPNTPLYEEDDQREKTSSQTSRRSTRETNPTKRSESSTSNRSSAALSPISNASRKPRSSLKPSASPTTNRRSVSRRKKRPLSVIDIERRQLSEPNDSEKQDLTAQGLSMVPAEIFEFITLRRLILSNNNLSGLPPAINSLINLEYLDLSHNPLVVNNGFDDYSCFPREFNNLKSLKTLILSECALKYIPVAVWNVVSLQTLDLSRNKVGYIVGDIGNLSDIRHLRLSHMDLDTLPPEIGFCDKLETIDLTENPIDNLPETLVECRQLYEFKINYKTFYKLLDAYMLQLIEEGKIRSEHIPQVIFELENLRILDLNNTKINSISNEHMLLNLTELYLSNNSFFDIPEAICTIEKLKILDMSHNRIPTIPEYFIKMKQLEIVNFSYNKLTLLSKIFAYLPILKELIISHNKLDTIENEFSKTQSLLTLDLSYNNLKYLPDELCELAQLETLDLRYNKLEYLPSNIRHMIGLKSMNTFVGTFQRFGLHLLGNLITNPPSYIWKSTNIQTLFNYIEVKEKNLTNSFYHLKLILIGPKNIGKTTLARKLVNNRKKVSNTRKTIDMYVSILQQKQLNNDEQDNSQQQQQQQTSNDPTSSALVDQWIENRISTSGDYLYSRHLKIKRINPPPLKTYRSIETTNSIINKSTLITKNNFYCTIFDLENEPCFEILYPLIYDSNALYILPVNLTILLNNFQVTTSLGNINEDENSLTIINFDALLTNDWLYYHIFRYLESISDHCQQVSITILGLIDDSQLTSNDRQQQQLLDEIRSKVNAFLIDEGDQRENIKFYSEYFLEPIHINDDQISSLIIEQLETITQQWNIVHHKQKRQLIKQRFAFLKHDALIINYDTCLKRFEQQKQVPLILSDNDDEIEENKQLIEEELNSMSFDECLDYLKLIGDMFCFGQKSHMRILIKPYHLLNKILSNTLFRPNIDQWLNYDDNMVFRFSGYYPSEKLFDIDRQRLLTRGEFTWNMLNVLFYEQNNNNISLTEQKIFDYCYLMERLYLGYLNQSNLNYIDYINYFKSLEQKRQYEHLQCEQSRRIKQQQLWFSIDNKENIENESSLQINTMNLTQKEVYQNISIIISELPSVDQIQIFDSQIINQDSIQTIKILNGDSNILPNGFYERLLICLHPLFYERLDYYNLTLGRTIDRNLIKIERFDEHNQIHLTINNNLLERIQNILTHNLFSFYSTKNLRIET